MCASFFSHCGEKKQDFQEKSHAATEGACKLWIIGQSWNQRANQALQHLKEPLLLYAENALTITAMNSWHPTWEYIY